MVRVARALSMSFVLVAAVFGCDGNAPPPNAATATAAGALTAADRTDSARAAVYAAKAARYRTAAAAQRQQAAAYVRWSPKATDAVTTNWNEQLRATHESRAAAAEAIAAEIQTFADFHTAEASKQVGR